MREIVIRLYPLSSGKIICKANVSCGECPFMSCCSNLPIHKKAVEEVDKG